VISSVQLYCSVHAFRRNWIYRT